jgi:phage terminase large subunit
MKACKGPGKTAVLAWTMWNYLVTRPHPKVG